ncbi:AraC family transcriptional regulator [Paenibacillus paeoniae]|uniref:AraC family transcriptional regulator n=1 Tax=Paenibacillus paeoniae TaxID=2292705 RepID=A0A371PEH7_9BACL|nr:AraC family transcriptional regulator [Paenibacillus paeoniae]REK74289.1 AraC family transcriptional regulator [Paenibacillus paeoniae]
MIDRDKHLLMWNYAYIKILDIRQIRMEKGQALPLYQLPAHSYLFAINGSAYIDLGGERHKVSSFQLLHGGKGLAISIEAVDDFKYFMIMYKAILPFTFRADVMQLWQKQNPFYDHYAIKPSHPLPLYSLAEGMFNHWQSSSSWHRLQVKSSMYQFVVELMDQLEEENTTVIKPDLLTHVRGYMHDHYHEPISLDSIAATTGYSAGYISRQFKEQLNMSPIYYLGKIRIEHASRLLLQSNATLQQIAEQVGYPDGFTLSRSFKRYKGVSPAVFRERKNDSLDEDLLYNRSKIAILPKRSNRYSEFEVDNHYQLKGDVSKTMYKSFKVTAMTVMLCITLLLSACSGAANQAVNPGTAVISEAGNQGQQEQKEPAQQKTTRTVSTLRGDVEVPLNPERVAADQYMGHLVKLGIIPVGVREEMLDEAWMEKAGLTEEILSKIENLGAFPMNPEKLIMLEPDLIIGSIEDSIEQYQKISTTVFLPYWEELSTAGPIEKFKSIAKIFGKEQEADEWVKGYEQEVAKSKEQIAGVIKEGETVSVVQFAYNGLYVLAAEGGNYGSSTIYQMMDLPPTEQAKNMPQGFASISLEALPEYLGDHVFVYISTPEDAKEIMDSAVWKSAEAVKKGNVYLYGQSGDEFVMEDPYSLEMQLQKITSLLLAKKQ